MNNKLLLIVILLCIILFVLRKKSISREEMIDFLNINVGYENGVWTKLSDEELRTVYKPLALIKQQVTPATGDYLAAVEIGRKYNLNTFK